MNRNRKGWEDTKRGNENARRDRGLRRTVIRRERERYMKGKDRKGKDRKRQRSKGSNGKK